MSPALELACRIALGAMIASAIVIGLPHRVRADRAGGHVSARSDPRWFWIGMAIIGPPLVFVCVAFLAAPPWLTFGVLPLPAPLRLFGIAFVVAGVALFAWMFHHLGLNVTSTAMPRAGATLVTSGPYRWIRHPMYSAALLLAGATFLLTANIIALVCGCGMFALLAARSRLEETRLIGKFGADYISYRQRTGRFFPRLWRDS